MSPVADTAKHAHDDDGPGVTFPAGFISLQDESSDSEFSPAITRPIPGERSKTHVHPRHRIQQA